MICAIFLILAVGSLWHSTQMKTVKQAEDDDTERLKASTDAVRRKVQCVEQEINYIEAVRTGADFGQEDP